MKTVDAVRAILEYMPDAPAADIATEVMKRYGVGTTAAYVRVVRSRDTREAGIVRPRTARPNPVPVSVPAPTPRTRETASKRRKHDELDDDQADRQVFELIDRTVAAIEKALSGAPQQVTGSPDLIAEIAAVLDDDEIRRDYPGYKYDVFSDGRYKTLRLYNAELLPADPMPDHNDVHVPRDPRDFTIADRPRKSSKTRERECDFCEGKRQHVLGIDLYQVRGGPIGPRLVILCGMHAQAMAAAGSDVRPYRVTSPAGYGIVRPEPVPYKEMLVNAGRTYLGLDDKH